MHLGKDFWFILKIVEFILKCLKEWSKDNNDDTEEGKV